MSCGTALPSQPSGSFADSGGDPSPVGGMGATLSDPHPIPCSSAEPLRRHACHRGPWPALAVARLESCPDTASLETHPCPPASPEGRVPRPAAAAHLPPFPQSIKCFFLPLCFPWPLVLVGHARAWASSWAPHSPCLVSSPPVTGDSPPSSGQVTLGHGCSGAVLERGAHPPGLRLCAHTRGQIGWEGPQAADLGSPSQALRLRAQGGVWGPQPSVVAGPHPTSALGGSTGGSVPRTAAAFNCFVSPKFR